MSDSTIDRPRIELGHVVLDTDNPPRLAEFYSQLLGWPIICADEDWWTIQSDSGGPKLDLDVSVAELPAAVVRAQSLGAALADNSASNASFVVLLDPSGHPFCLCAC